MLGKKESMFEKKIRFSLMVQQKSKGGTKFCYDMMDEDK